MWFEFSPISPSRDNSSMSRERERRIMASNEITAAAPVHQAEKKDPGLATAKIRSGDSPQKSEAVPSYDDFKLSVTGRLIFFTLAMLTLMVALDGTSISVALPVSR
jgi:hypothetical protein